MMVAKSYAVKSGVGYQIFLCAAKMPLNWSFPDRGGSGDGICLSVITRWILTAKVLPAGSE